LDQKLAEDCDFLCSKELVRAMVGLAGTTVGCQEIFDTKDTALILREDILYSTSVEAFVLAIKQILSVFYG
jgi:hypothetical protein